MNIRGKLSRIGISIGVLAASIAVFIAAFFGLQIYADSQKPAQTEVLATTGRLQIGDVIRLNDLQTITVFDDQATEAFLPAGAITNTVGGIVRMPVEAGQPLLQQSVLARSTAQTWLASVLSDRPGMSLMPLPLDQNNVVAPPLDAYLPGDYVDVTVVVDRQPQVVGGGLGLVALLLPTAFRGNVPERRADEVDAVMLSFLVHVRLKIDEGLVPALEAYARGYDNVLADELDALLQTFNTGADLDELFAELARKYDNRYLRDFASSLRELREQSDPEQLLAAFLRQSIKEMRAERMRQIEQRIIRSVSVGVLCLLPGLFLVLLTPGIFIFMENFG